MWLAALMGAEKAREERAHLRKPVHDPIRSVEPEVNVCVCAALVAVDAQVAAFSCEAAADLLAWRDGAVVIWHAVAAMARIHRVHVLHAWPRDALVAEEQQFVGPEGFRVLDAVRAACGPARDAADLRAPPRGPGCGSTPTRRGAGGTAVTPESDSASLSRSMSCACCAWNSASSSAHLRLLRASQLLSSIG